MTPLEKKIRTAIREKADQVPADAVPPLLLPVRRRRPFSLAYGGGQSYGAPAWRAWLAPAASAILVAAVICGSVAVSRIVLRARAGGRGGPDAATMQLSAASVQAAAWVAAQVSRSAVISCDPVMCQALRAHGIPARDLDVLGRRGGSPLGAEVIVATAAVRRALGGRLSSVYAPAVIASFGSGSARTDVRVIAPDGAAAYLRALSADLASRKSAGAELLRSPRIRMSAAARRQLQAGHVDTRLMIAIVSISGSLDSPLSILGFADPGPGAGAACPLRSAQLAGSSFDVQQILGFLRAQRAPFAPAWARRERLPGGQRVLSVEFAAPSPLGLLAGNGA